MLQGTSSLDIKKNLFTERIAKFWNSLPREVVDSPVVGIFKRHVDVMLSDMV